MLEEETTQQWAFQTLCSVDAAMEYMEKRVSLESSLASARSTYISERSMLGTVQGLDYFRAMQVFVRMASMDTWRERMARITLGRKFRTLVASAFDQWVWLFFHQRQVRVHQTKQGLRLQTVLLLLVRRLVSYTLRRSFAVLLINTGVRRRKNKVALMIRAAFFRRLNAVLKAAVDCWSEYSRALERVQALIRRAAGKWQTRLAQTKLCSWRQWQELCIHGKRCRSLKMRCARTLHRLQRGLLGLVLDRWCEAAFAEEREQRLMRKVVKMLVSRVCLRFWELWRLAVEEQQMIVADARRQPRVLARTHHKLRKAAWDRWLENLILFRRVQRKTARALSHWVNGKSARIFRHWQIYHATAKHYKLVVGRALSKLELRAATCLQEWQLVTKTIFRRVNKTNIIIRRRYTRTSRAVVGRWCEAVAQRQGDLLKDHQRLHASNGLAFRGNRKLVSVTLSAWWQEVSAHHRWFDLLRRIELKLLCSSLLHAMERWRVAGLYSQKLCVTSSYILAHHHTVSHHHAYTMERWRVAGLYSQKSCVCMYLSTRALTERMYGSGGAQGRADAGGKESSSEAEDDKKNDEWCAAVLL